MKEEVNQNSVSDNDLKKQWDDKMGTSANAEQSEEGPAYGIKGLLDKALRAYEKLPMLEIVFDKLIRLLTTAFRNLTSETVNIEIITFNSLRFGQYMNTVPSPTLITVFKALEWENFGLLIIDSSLVYAFVDNLFGGKKSIKEHKLANRNYTDIEQALVRQISDVLLNELGSSFDPITPATFAFERLESNPNFVSIARTGDAAILLQLKVEIEDRGGKIDIVIPYSTLEPIKGLLSQVFMGEKFGIDAEWEEILLESTYEVDIPLEAVIISTPTTILDLTKLEVGNTLIIEHEKDEDIIVKSENVQLFKGKLGKVEEKLAVNVTEFIEKSEEVI